MFAAITSVGSQRWQVTDKVDQIADCEDAIYLEAVDEKEAAEELFAKLMAMHDVDYPAGLSRVNRHYTGCNAVMVEDEPSVSCLRRAMEIVDNCEAGIKTVRMRGYLDPGWDTNIHERAAVFDRIDVTSLATNRGYARVPMTGDVILHEPLDGGSYVMVVPHKEWVKVAREVIKKSKRLIVSTVKNLAYLMLGDYLKHIQARTYSVTMDLKISGISESRAAVIALFSMAGDLRKSNIWRDETRNQARLCLSSNIKDEDLMAVIKKVARRKLIGNMIPPVRAPVARG